MAPWLQVNPLKQHGPTPSSQVNTITLVPLPSASPKLNPVERIWRYRRERYPSRRVLNDYDALLEAVCGAWNRLLDETDPLISLTAYPHLTASRIL